jgi:hypothetical protein
MRLAFQALAKPVANLFKGASKTDLAMRFGPDVGYSLMAGTMFAPEDASMGERAAMMGEDLVYGLGSSIAGQLGGRALGARRAAAKGLTGQAAEAMTQGFQTGGDVLGQMGMVALPRPISQGVYEAAGERANQSQEQISANQQEMVEEQQLAAAMLGLTQAGYLAGQGSQSPGVLGLGPMMTTPTRQVGY